VNALTLHGRARTQGYGIKADWEIIGRAKAQLRIPVIGNGDLTSPEAVLDFFTRTGCAGAMIGRGALGNPWIFRQTLDMLQGQPCREPSPEEKEEAILRHLEMMIGRRGDVHGLKEFRKHLIWYTRGLKGCSEFRARIPLWKTVSEMSERVHDFFQNLRKLPLFS
jgi:tRNA-dihydrouridine synthase B